MNLKELFQDKEGKLSSKRVFGFTLLVYSMIMYTLGSVGLVVNDAVTLGLFIGAGITGIGLGVAERRK
jgi:hypothetical protein